MPGYDRDRYYSRRSAWFKGKRCAECGSRKSLELDHTDPSTKDRTIRCVWTTSPERMERELAKCQALCRRCHRLKSNREMSGKNKRGFASMSIERRREIASMGGKAVPNEKRSFSYDRKLAAEAGRKGGKAVKPENRKFTRDKEFAAECGRKGGLVPKSIKEASSQ